jgi:triosephosphate isomerase (TIM)
MKTTLIVGNWKMNTSLAEARMLARAVLHGVEHIERIQTVLCPPTIWLTEIAHHDIPFGKLPHLALGAQTAHQADSGAFTGETGMGMLQGLVAYVILGHSERMQYYNETLTAVGQKALAALAKKITPIICLGEVHQSPTSIDEVRAQAANLAAQISTENYQDIVIAYEPVWAIGTGQAAIPEYAAEVMRAIHQVFNGKSRVLYGGSVNAENAQGFLDLPETDGFLIGGASLNQKTFVQICQKADDRAQKCGQRSLHPEPHRN